MKKVAIVVHIYKSTLSPDEQISLRQLHAVLGNYPVYIVAPTGLDTSAYADILQSQLARTIEYHPRYFAGLNGYNQLLLDHRYYEPFLDFDFILLHHTDAFVFTDELAFWMDQDLDNIGAPAYEYDGTMHPQRFIAACNGGLCLRKVKTFYDLAQSRISVFRYQDVFTDFLRYNWRGRVARSIYYLTLLTKRGTRLISGRNLIRENEDVIWGYYVAKYIPEFRNATFEDGLKFSMEFNCDVLMEQNYSKPPFGCHGWYTPMFRDFWKPYIEKFGYTVSSR